MTSSILTTTKKALGLAEDYTPYDPELTMHINSTLSVMNQLGVGPKEGFAIADATETWEDFLGDDLRYNMAQSYMYLSVRMLFDPPTVGYVLTAFEKQKEEAAWRLNTQREYIDYPPTPPSEVVEPLMIVPMGVEEKVSVLVDPNEPHPENENVVPVPPEILGEEVTT